MLTFLTSWYDASFMFFTINKAPNFPSGRPKSTSYLANRDNWNVLDENTYCTRIGTELRNHADNGCGRVKDVRAFARSRQLFLRIPTAHENSHGTSCIERALSTKMKSDRADGHWYSFAWDLTILDVRWPPFFFSETDFIYNYLHIVQKWRKNQCGKLKKIFKISVHGTSNSAIMQLQGAWNCQNCGR